MRSRVAVLTAGTLVLSMKNYQLLVIAQTDAEKRAAIETTPARKLREIRMALTLDKTLTKPEILTSYLNLVSFGNGAFGIQDAAQTYFGRQRLRAELAAGRAAGRHGAVHQRAESVHQPRRRAGPPEPRAGHHDREHPAGGRGAARAPSRSRWACCRTPNELPRGLHRGRRPRLLLRLRAGVPGPGRASARSRSPRAGT